METKPTKHTYIVTLDPGARALSAGQYDAVEGVLSAINIKMILYIHFMLDERGNRTVAPIYDGDKGCIFRTEVEHE